MYLTDSHDILSSNIEKCATDDAHMNQKIPSQREGIFPFTISKLP
jgi:hypothetical protein